MLKGMFKCKDSSLHTYMATLNVSGVIMFYICSAIINDSFAVHLRALSSAVLTYLYFWVLQDRGFNFSPGCTLYISTA